MHVTTASAIVSVLRRATSAEILIVTQSRPLRRDRPPTRDDALDKLDDVLGEDTNGTPAAPLYDLIGLVDEDEGQRLRERSREFRAEIDERVERTRRDLSDEG